jgi:hypothetical protein
VGARLLSLDYEASNLVQSLFLDAGGGSVPVNPSQYATRFVLKLVSPFRSGRDKLTENN